MLTPPNLTTHTPTPAPYAGYGLTRVRRAGGDETVRFEAVLVRDGRPIAHVYNSGEGGAHRWSPIDTGGWAAIDRFNDYARAWNATGEFAGIEAGDQLVNRLLEVAQMNRLRSTAFVLDGADFWTTGEYAVFRGATREQTTEALRSPAYAERQREVWSRWAVTSSRLSEGFGASPMPAAATGASAPILRLCLWTGRRCPVSSLVA